eukprot:364500-Chlamydomonas_euryale.AAC.19
MRGRVCSRDRGARCAVARSYVALSFATLMPLGRTTERVDGRAAAGQRAGHRLCHWHVRHAGRARLRLRPPRRRTSGASCLPMRPRRVPHRRSPVRSMQRQCNVAWRPKSGRWMSLVSPALGRTWVPGHACTAAAAAMPASLRFVCALLAGFAHTHACASQRTPACRTPGPCMGSQYLSAAC